MVDLLDPFVLGGHTGYGTGFKESGGDDGGGGISTASILIVLLLAMGAAGLLVALNPSGTKARLKRFAPGALIVLIMAAPLALWAATSGSDGKSLIVERAKSPTGSPELILSLAETELNTMDATDGRRTVRVECLDRDERVVLEVRERWPFPRERGWDYPHRHQAATADQLRRAERCRIKGTTVRLEAEVQGRL